MTLCGVEVLPVNYQAIFFEDDDNGVAVTVTTIIPSDMLQGVGLTDSFQCHLEDCVVQWGCDRCHIQTLTVKRHS